MRTYEAYEDNAGGLAIFALDDGKAVWSCYYKGCEREMGIDWGELVLANRDPIVDGWDNDDLDPDEWIGEKIADSEWSNLPYGIDVESCGIAGSLFAMHAGAASICTSCRSVIPSVRNATYPDAWDVFETCPVCGGVTMTLC